MRGKDLESHCLPGVTSPMTMNGLLNVREIEFPHP